jgi:hypothetical protein
MKGVRAARADLYARWGKTAAEQVHGMLQELVPEGRASRIPGLGAHPAWALGALPCEPGGRLEARPDLDELSRAVDDTFKAAGTVHGTSPQLVGVVGKSLATALSMPLAFVVRVPLSHQTADGCGIKGEDVAVGLTALWERLLAMSLPRHASFPARTSSGGAREYFIGACSSKARVLLVPLLRAELKRVKDLSPLLRAISAAVEAAARASAAAAARVTASADSSVAQGTDSTEAEVAAVVRRLTAVMTELERTGNDPDTGDEMR